MLTRFRRAYGAGPLHALLFVVCAAVAALAIRRWFDVGGHDARVIITWFVALILAHDLVLVPLYSLIPRLLSRTPARGPGPARYHRARLHLRIPALLSALLLLVWSPLILRASHGDFAARAGLTTHPYLARWVIATVGLFAVSGLVWLVRAVRSGRGHAPATRRS